MPETKKKNWLAEHPTLSVIMGVIVLVLILSVFQINKNKTQQSSSAIINEGYTTTLTIGNYAFEVSADKIGSDNTADLTINGVQTTGLTRGDTYEIGAGFYINVRDILYSSKSDVLSRVVINIATTDNQGNLATENNSNTQNKQTATPTQISTPAIEEELNKATMGEKNALSKALSYLRYTSFSYSGLIKQLEFEGFTHQEAVYGVDNCGADWKEQAALKAQSYLDYSAFSKQGLIDQLEFEGFTKEQAEYGVQAV